MKLFVTAAAAALVFGAAAPAMAQTDTSPDGVYANLGWSQTYTQGAHPGEITGRVGGRFARYFGVEGEVGYGLSTGSRTFHSGLADQRTVDIKQRLDASAYAVGFLPLTPEFDLLARVGYGATHYRVEPSGLPDYRSNQHGVRFGAGAQYLVSAANGIRFDYTRENLNGSDPGGFFSASNHADVWTLAFAHKF